MKTKKSRSPPTIPIKVVVYARGIKIKAKKAS
jgi:hypothetical protein